MSVEFSQLIAFQKKLEQLDKKIQDDVCKDVVNGLASQLVEATKLRTPVGKYPKTSYKIGGTLRRRWKAKGHKIPRGYEATVYNNIRYAPYVEYGHRIVRNNKAIGFVSGHHMLEKSINEIRKIADDYANKRLEETMRRILVSGK